jgi:hypothetical protein
MLSIFIRQVRVDNWPWMQSSTASANRAQSSRFVRTEYVQSRSLDLHQLSALLDRLYIVSRETLYGRSRDEFEAMLLEAGEVTIAIFYGEGGDIAGFAYYGIQRMEYAGRLHALNFGGAFFRAGYSGGSSSALFGLRMSLRFKLRAPRTPLNFLTRCATPAAYRLVVSTMPRAYPNRRYNTPADIDAMVRKFSVQRGYDPLSGNPWIVRQKVAPCNPERMRCLENDPDVQFYMKLAPSFAEGESLLTWIPMDVVNIAGAFSRICTARWRRVLGTSRERRSARISFGTSEDQ